MASPQVGSGPAKMSFAEVRDNVLTTLVRSNDTCSQIAARPPPTQAIKPVHITQGEMSPRSKENMAMRRQSQGKRVISPKPKSASLQQLQPITEPIGEVTKSPTGAIEGLALVKNAALEKEAAKIRLPAGADSNEDDQSHLSNNSSREPPSFDTKSIASVTTFAMDEKESLRPDDSASVQAVDDEDSSSGPSCDPSVQGESEQMILPRGLPQPSGNMIGMTRRYPSITLANPPRFGDLPMSPITESEEVRQARILPQEIIDVDAPQLRGGGPENRSQMLAVMPDEKLLDALASPKDRLPLLQLEEKILAFIALAQRTGPEILDLPPQNSFGRLLAHKLADYYSLQHVISDDNASVRLFMLRGLVMSLPTSLAVIATSIPTGPVPAPGSAAFKIMRRNGMGGRNHSAGGSTAASSSAPSKATSENGGDGSEEGFMSPPDGTPQKDRPTLTREEREANYKAARERIFADFQESLPSEAASTTGDTSASISRSSSSSGKRKTGKQRRPIDDSFEARSQFIQGSYSTMPIVGQQNAYQGPYNESTFGMQYPAPPGTIASNYGSTPTQTYSNYEAPMQYPGMPNYSNPIQQAYPSGDQWSSPHSPQPGNYYDYSHNPAQQVYPSSQTPVNAINQYSQPMSMPPPVVPQGWASTQYQNSFQQTPTLQNPQPVQWSGYSSSPNAAGPNPYPYGQLPPQLYPTPTYNAQHPVPGSYGGNRSLFNPNSRSFVPNNTTSRSGGRNANRKKNSTNNANQSKQKSSASENTIPIPQRPSQPASSNSSPGAKDLPLQQKYGAPAHLPKKPPPSQVPAPLEFDMQALKLGSTVAGLAAGPLVVNGEARESRA
jgi:hypothetical protein